MRMSVQHGYLLRAASCKPPLSLLVGFALNKRRRKPGVFSKFRASSSVKRSASDQPAPDSVVVTKDRQGFAYRIPGMLPTARGHPIFAIELLISY